MDKLNVIRVVDFRSSLFWSLAGVISVGCTITAINQRVRVQDERLDMLRERNAAAEQVARLQQEAAQARSKVQLLEAQLEGATGWRWKPVWEQLANTLISLERSPRQ